MNNLNNNLLSLFYLMASYESFHITILFHPLDSGPSVEYEPSLKPMSKRDFTPRQLKPFDGTKSEDNPEGRILIGVLGKVYDMTKGKSFYGPGKFINVYL